MARSFIVTADGGSRGNPGPAAYGAVVFEGDKFRGKLALQLIMLPNIVD